MLRVKMSEDGLQEVLATVVVARDDEWNRELEGPEFETVLPTEAEAASHQEARVRAASIGRTEFRRSSDKAGTYELTAWITNSLGLDANALWRQCSIEQSQLNLDSIGDMDAFAPEYIES